MKPIPSRILRLVTFALALPLDAANYFIAVDGNDANPGTDALPWRTIQKAAGTLQPGDTVIVREGAYNERITTVRGGTNESSRITFEANGEVTMHGWIINHPHITVRGFNISGHSASTTSDAHIKVNAGGDNFYLVNCLVGNVPYATPPDAVFAVDSSISSATFDFEAEGFAVGQYVTCYPATNGVVISTGNRGPFLITNLHGGRLYLDATITNLGPVHIFLTSAFQYALWFHSGATNALIQGNRFTELGFDCWYVNGAGHRLEANVVERVNGWDVMHFIGDNHVFARNWFRDSPLVAYQVSPDWSENFSGTQYRNVVFTNNFVEGVTAVLGAQKTSGSVSGPLIYTRNVFVDLGRFTGIFHETTFENNTFVRCAAQNNPVMSLARHVLYLGVEATNAVIRNNIFVDCGQRTFPYTESEMGWYQINGSTSTVVAEGNFVAGGPPGFGAKIGWPEGNPLLNGGDPGFGNINDPLGPDGIPFTDDDGLRPLPNSKLVLAGAGGRTIGAYELPGGGQPKLVAQKASPNQLRLTWPQTVETWNLQSSTSLYGNWANVPVSPQLDNGQIEVILGTTNPAAFYRLIR